MNKEELKTLTEVANKVRGLPCIQEIKLIIDSYTKGCIELYKARQSKQGEGVKRRSCTCHLKPYSEFTPLEKEYGCYNCGRKPSPKGNN